MMYISWNGYIDRYKIRISEFHCFKCFLFCFGVGELLVYSLHEGFRACSKCFGAGGGGGGGLLVYSLHEGFRACSKCFGVGWGAAGLLPS